MPNILILGGTGYLGQAVSQALLRSGNHSVWGTVRPGSTSQSKARTLSLNEITPVIGDATDPAWLAKTIADHRIDVVIDITQAYDKAGVILDAVISAARNRAEVLAKEQAAGPKLGYIYTSGSWVHGSPGLGVGRKAGDLTVPGTSLAPAKPATAVAWRPAHEQAVLAAREVLDVAVVRPGAIYGRASWVWGTFWSPLLAASKDADNNANEVQIPADAGARIGTVHVDDLAEAYMRVVDRVHGLLGSWPVFDVTSEVLPVPDIVQAAAEVLGVEKKRIVYAGTEGNPFLEALSLVVNTDSARARCVLGWEAKRRGFVLNLGVFVEAWRAAQAQGE
jgi:nucleoside-diphosphate-sugar epimerase